MNSNFLHLLVQNIRKTANAPHKTLNFDHELINLELKFISVRTFLDDDIEMQIRKCNQKYLIYRIESRVMRRFPGVLSA